MVKRRWMNQAQYAEHRGVTQQVVSADCRSGKLSGAAKKNPKGLWQIDQAKADALLAERSNPARTKDAQQKWKKKRKPYKKKDPPQEAEIEKTIQEAGFEGLGYYEARTENERYKAALNKLKFQTATKNLVRRSEVERAAYNVGRSVRDAVLNVPPRVSSILAGEMDQFKVEKALTEELKKALDELSSGKYHTGSDPEHAA
jgi:hypothetical protein